MLPLLRSSIGPLCVPFSKGKRFFYFSVLLFRFFTARRIVPTPLLFLWEKFNHKKNHFIFHKKRKQNFYFYFKIRNFSKYLSSHFSKQTQQTRMAFVYNSPGGMVGVPQPAYAPVLIAQPDGKQFLMYQQQPMPAAMPNFIPQAQPMQYVHVQAGPGAPFQPTLVPQQQPMFIPYGAAPQP